MTPDSKKNNTSEKDTAKTATTLDPKVKASKPASGESAKPNAAPKDAKDINPAKEATAPKDSKKGPKAPKKKQSYKIVGGCVAAALLIACIGFASCNANSSSKAEATATPTATAKAESLFADAKEVTLLDANGKETTDKITVATVKKAEATKADLQDWYYNDVVKNGYKYGILKYTDDSGKGIYADSTGIYEAELKEDTATRGYTKPADTSLIYTVDASKKTLDSAKKSGSSAAPKATASADAAAAKEEKGDTAADTGSNTSSDSGKSGSSASQGSKLAGGSSNSSSGSKTSNTSGSSSKSQTCKTVHHDATGHYENTTTQQWVQDSAAWDETVVDQAAWDEQVNTGKAVAVCGMCHRTFNSAEEVGEHIVDDHDGYGNYWAEPVYQTVHHDAVTHVVHHDATGHYETVVTGQQWIQDRAAYDETVCG